MKKRIAALLIAFAVAFVPVTASAVSIPTVIGGVIAVIGAIDDVYSFGQLICETWSGFYEGITTAPELRKQQVLAYWNEIIIQADLTEADFKEYYNHVLEVSGNVAYYTPPVSDEQMSVVNAYVAILEGSSVGLLLDDICAYCFTAGTASDNPDTGFDNNGNVTVSGKTFSEICAQLQEQYAPGNSEGKLSWLEGDGMYPWNNHNTCSFTIFVDGYYISSDNKQSTGVYLKPYYYDGTEYYYSDKTWHFYATTNDEDAVILQLDVYNYEGDLIMSNPLDAHDLSKRRFFIVNAVSENKQVYMRSYDTAINYENCGEVSSSQNLSASWVNLNTSSCLFYDTELNEGGFTFETFEFASIGPTDISYKDVGFIWSNEPLEMGLFKDIDTTQIPDNYYITINGDNIYDYDITNPDTGDTSTVNEYITNNYTFITNNNGGDGSGGGSVSGDVTVSGNIDVGGKVDININVNQDSGSSGSNAEPYDYVDVNLDEALEQIPEMGTGFTDFLQQIFTWLPAEVVGLIIGGIGIAILCRVAGR